MAGLKNFS
ncbi:hypothetical protein VCHC57A1_0731, partial [Vibrio cholerae HC-57A1]